MRRTTSEISPNNGRPIDCARCFTRMTLNRTEPRPLGYELRVFECARCDIEHQVFVAVDPMKSPGAGWANSNLQAPD